MSALAPWEHDTPVQLAAQPAAATAAPWEKDAPVGPPITQQSTPIAQPSAPIAQQSAPAIDPNTLQISNQERPSQIFTQALGKSGADILGTGSDLATTGQHLAASAAEHIAGWLTGHDLTGVIPRVPDALGSDAISGAASKVAGAAGIPTIDEKDMTSGERLEYNATRFGSQGLIAGTGLAGAVPEAASSAPARSILGRIFQKLGQAYTERPVSTIAGDTAAGAGAGTTSTAYDEYAPDAVKNSAADPYLRALTFLAGGVGGGGLKAVGEGLLSGGTSGVKSVLGLNAERDLPGGTFNPLTKDFYTTNQANKAAAILQDRASNPEAAATSIGELFRQLAPSVPTEAMPSTGTMSNDAGLITAENAARTLDPVPAIEQSRRLQTQARGMVADTIPPGSDARDLTNFGNTQQAAREAQAAQDAADAQAQLEATTGARSDNADLLNSLEGNRGPAALDLDERIVEDTLRPMQAASSQEYATARELGKGSFVPVDNLIDNATKVRDTLGTLNSANKVIPSALLRRIDSLDPNVAGPEFSGDVTSTQLPISDIVDIMPELATTETRARQVGNYQLADNIRDLRGSMIDSVQAAAQGGDEAALQFMHARQNYADTVGQAFGPGQGDAGYKFRKDFNLDKNDRSRTPPSQTADRFLQPGQPEKADALQRIISQSANPDEAHANVREFLLSDLAQSGAVDRQTGAVNAEAIRRWNNRWGSTLDAFPDVKGEVADMAAKTDELNQAQAGAEKGVQTAQANLADVQADHGAFKNLVGHSPDRAMDAVFNSNDPESAMKEIVDATANDPQAKAGLKNALTNYLLKNDTLDSTERTTTGERPLSGAKMGSRFDHFREVLAQVYTPEEMNSLQTANTLLDVEQRERLGAGGSDKTEKLGSPNMRVLEIGLKGWYGILKGGGVFRSAKLALANLPHTSADAVDQLVSQARFDPELAQHLLTRDVNAGSPAWNRKLLSLMTKTQFARSYNEDQNAETPGK